MKSIADHVAAGDSLHETAATLGLSIDEVRRWAHEMMVILQVRSIADLTDRLQTMQYGDGGVREWRRGMFTQHGETSPTGPDSAIA